MGLALNQVIKVGSYVVNRDGLGAGSGCKDRDERQNQPPRRKGTVSNGQ